MENKKGTNSFKWIAIVILVLLILAAAGVGIGLAMRLRLPEQALVCGVDVSDMLAEDAKVLLEDRINNYSLQVVVGDQTFSITAEDMGVSFLSDTFEDVVQAMVDSGEETDPLSFMSIDRDKLASYVNSAFDEKRVAPVLPEIVWNEHEKCYTAVAGEPETWYSREKLTEMVYEAVMSLPAVLEIDEAELYQEHLDVQKDALAADLAQQANDMMKLELELVFNPRQVEVGREVVSSDAIASFLRFDIENGSISVDKDTAMTYVETFAPNYTYSKNKDRFVTHSGGRIRTTVQFEDQTVDIEATANLIADCILQKTPGSFEVPYAGAVNFDGTYIEVSIPEQHLWYYEDGKVVLDADVVTGNVAAGKQTPTGLNYIRGHLRQIYLMGTHFVEYWMSITVGGMYGFHDADHWRQPEEYGGDTYMGNGSGGCVNVPVEKMAKLYEMVADLTPVVIYDYYHFY